MDRPSVSRRRFLAQVTGREISGATRRSSRVVWVHAPECLDDAGELRDAQAERMIRAVFDRLPEASRLFGSRDRVAVKLNCLAGPGLSPKPALVHALCGRIMEYGVRPENILVWDRTNRELRRAGYVIRQTGQGVRVFGTDALSPAYEDEPFVHRSVGSCYSRILTRFATVVVGVGVLKDHDLSGVSLGMKNFFGVIHNPNKYHDSNCNPYLADLCSEPVLRSRWRLSILDATHGQCHGGPALNNAYRWRERAVIAGLDPVAVDRVGWDRIEEKRAGMGLKSLEQEGRRPAWLETAEALNLGTCRPERIDIVRVVV